MGAVSSTDRQATWQQLHASNGPAPVVGGRLRPLLVGLRVLGRLAIALAQLFALYTICTWAIDIRMHAVRNYGRIIHEFDPWFNMRATQYLHDNGWEKFSTCAPALHTLPSPSPRSLSLSLSVHSPLASALCTHAPPLTPAERGGVAAGMTTRSGTQWADLSVPLSTRACR
jgi:hypothetical protein